jgi:hypothetical protein
MTDFPEESDVLAQAIRISSQCTAEPITGHVWPSDSVLWPPNHRMVQVEINVSALVSRNPGSFQAHIEAVSVEDAHRGGDDDENGHERGDGADAHAPDWEIVDALTVKLRAERRGKSMGRIYRISVLATDCSGEYRFVAEVNVPHDHGK